MERPGYLREAKCSCSNKPFINPQEIWVYKCEFFLKKFKRRASDLLFPLALLLPTESFFLGGGGQHKTPHYKVSSSKQTDKLHLHSVPEMQGKKTIWFGFYPECCRDEVYL